MGANQLALLVVAYPELPAQDFNFIQSYRKDNDEMYFNVIEPHFTIVFPVFDISREVFMKEINDRSAGHSKIEFVIRRATINKDAFTDYYHIFLVPDEGYSKIEKLHDKLYGSVLKKYLRTDIDYIPHIGVGNSKNQLRCMEMVDEWNKKEFEINGAISHLTIVNYENNAVTKLQEIELT